MEKKNILISVQCIKDIGGISTSIVNLLHEISDLYNISLCVPCNFISGHYTIPHNVTIIKGSNFLRDVVVDCQYLQNQTIFQKFIRNVRRLYKRYLGGAHCLDRAIKKINIPGKFDVALAFCDESFRNGKRFVYNYDYQLVLNNVDAEIKVAWIHNDPIKQGWTKELCLKELSGFNYIVNVSEDCKKIFDEIIPEFKYKSRVVLNTYNIQEIIHKSETQELLYDNNSRTHFVTVARVNCTQKRIDRIVETCRRLNEDGYNNFDWTIVGDGESRCELEQRCHDLNISNIIRFVGLKPNPYPYMKQADAFILTSQYEGFGMTTKEAQILGVPTFVTNFGPAQEAVLAGLQGEICENSTDGVYFMVKKILDKEYNIVKYRNYLKENPVTNKIAIEQFAAICKI